MSPIRHLARTVVVALAVAALAVAALAGCGSESGAPGAGSDQAALDGDWVLVAATVDGRDLDLSAGPVTLGIDGDQWRGQSACNTYFTTVTRDGDSVDLGAVGGTEMACDEPRMALEAAYWGALERVTEAARDGDALVLSGDGVTLSYDPVAETEPADLIGTEWALGSLLEGDTASSVIARPATLLLKEDGSVTGSTGCRNFLGQWSTEGDQLVIGPLGTPRIGCRGAAALQDKHVLAVLDGAVATTIDGTTLTVQNGSLGLVYAAG